MVASLPTPANTNKPHADEADREGRAASVLARAETAVADLARDYAGWALRDVAKARAALAAAMSEERERGLQVEAVFRVAHDLKGQGTSFGFPLVTRIGHSLCALTRDRALDHRQSHLELAKSHLDALERVLAKGIRGEGGKVGADLVAKLESRVAELLG